MHNFKEPTFTDHNEISEQMSKFVRGEITQEQHRKNMTEGAKRRIQICKDEINKIKEFLNERKDEGVNDNIIKVFGILEQFQKELKKSEWFIKYINS